MDINKKKTILIVEEESDTANLRAKFLKLGDFNTIIYNNAKKAMKFIEESYDKIDLILLDIMMPGRGGFSILEEVKNNEKYKKIHLLWFTDKHWDEGTGIWDFPRPIPRRLFSGKELLDELKEVLGQDDKH